MGAKAKNEQDAVLTELIDAIAENTDVKVKIDGDSGYWQLFCLLYFLYNIININ